jgi:hypothetical protein
MSHDARMPRLPIVSLMLLVLSAASLGLGGCASSGSPDIQWSTLPTREVQGTFPADFHKVHEAALQVVRDDMGYIVDAARIDEKKATSRIDGTLADGGSVRIATEKTHDMESTLVRVLAVGAGSRSGDPDMARDILERVREAVWAEKKK